MKKRTQKFKSIFGDEITLTIDKRLNDRKPGKFELEKLAEANKSLSKIKSLPK